VSPYSVFASRWDPERGSWEPETQVSPPDGNEHWWCDVTVDANGTPHVVWCELAATDNYPFFINYSYYDGHQWAGPIRVNDTAGVCAAPWAAPRIVTDREGTMHVCYTGVAVGATGRDIFYSRNDGSGWTPSVRVTQDTADNYSEWYSDIAADRPDNVWVTWDRQGEGSDQFRVYAAHFDGLLWSSEQRLDDDSASRRENCPSVCLDSTGCPWVFWNDESNGGDVYFNRYLGSGVAEPAAATLNSSPCVIASPNPSTGTVTIECGVPLAPGAGICIFSQDGRQVRRLAPGLTQPGGSPTTSTWDGTDELGRSVPGGVYLAVVEGQAGVRAKLVKLD